MLMYAKKKPLLPDWVWLVGGWIVMMLLIWFLGNEPDLILEPVTR